MRLALSLVTVLALALSGCAGDGTDPTGTPDTTATTAPPTGTEQPTAPQDDDDDGDGDDGTDTDGTEPAADTSEGDATEDGTDGDVAAEGDCSAAGLPAEAAFTDLGEEARATAEFLLDAAVRCDEQLLFTAATESDTSFLFGSASVDEVFALPEDEAGDPAPWEVLARLLAGTTPVEADGVWTWPAAFSPDAGDAAWQELVDSGLYTQAQVDQLRAAPDGYLGWRLAIEADGTWLFFTAGD